MAFLIGMFAFLAILMIAGLPATAQSPGKPSSATQVGADQTKAQPNKSKPQRRVLRVGPKHKYRRPSHAARYARDWDRILIDPGQYRDCAVWRANNLLIEGNGGKAHVRDISCQGKGIWVIKGNNTEIRNIEFSGADVPHNNGAGIRIEGRNLMIRNSYFHHNENGILGPPGRRPRDRITILNSVFERNGKCEPDCAHGIYIGKIGRLVVARSIFRSQMVGHHIKSRALYTRLIGNRIFDGADGTASMSINLPNGGNADIRGNYIEQGPRAENYRVMVSMGEEGNVNPTKRVFFGNNVFVNSNSRSTTFVRNKTRASVLLRSNRFDGAGIPLSGPGRVVR